MVFVNHTFEWTRVLKVLVVPIGENSMFDYHFDLISTMRIFTKDELKLDESWFREDCGFKSFTMEGNITLDYVRYDLVGSSSEVENYLTVGTAYFS